MIRKLIPRWIKDLLLYVVRIPQRCRLSLYYAASNGRIPFPDKAFQKWDYKIHTGRKLNLRHPVTFQEKLQWLKYYYHNPIQSTLVDKYKVRSWVAEKIGEQYLIPLLGVFHSFDDIPFSELPDQFVLKCNHDSGSVVICKNKSSFDYEKAKEKLEACLKINHFYKSREWPYKNIQERCILCEPYLVDDHLHDLKDYKFFCFDGKVKFLYVSTLGNHDNAVINYYYPDWERIPIKHELYKSTEKDDEIPNDFKKMISLAEILSCGFPHVRVDFFYANEAIYFSEMTFFSSGGRHLWSPEKYNYLFGDMITLPPKMRKKDVD
ncbi:MAG: glycosyl transferase [Clostridia bacterium]|nr:glycosyl transferase [Clostridia bacterium]